MRISAVEIDVPNAEKITVTEDTLSVDLERWPNYLCSGGLVSQVATRVVDRSVKTGG